MPHLEENLRYTTTHEKVCLTHQVLAAAFRSWITLRCVAADCGMRCGWAIPFPITLAYTLACEGGHGTTGEASWQIEAQRIRGTLNVKLGRQEHDFLSACDGVAVGKLSCMTRDLFDFRAAGAGARAIARCGCNPAARFRLAQSAQVLEAVAEVVRQSPFRHMITPGGFRMSVAMTNCGSAGGSPIEPGIGTMGSTQQRRRAGLPCRWHCRTWLPGRPARGGFVEFLPDACLINRYEPARACRCIRTKMSATWRSRGVSVAGAAGGVFVRWPAPRRQDSPNSARAR